MYAVPAYYDGTMVQPLEKLTAKPNQRIIITVMDEFITPNESIRPRSMRGALAQYANPALIEKEEGAWERALVEKHDYL